MDVGAGAPSSRAAEAMTLGRALADPPCRTVGRHAFQGISKHWFGQARDEVEPDCLWTAPAASG